MATKKTKSVALPTEIIRVGKDEMNLIEHPFASLWKNEIAESEIYLEWETTHPTLGKAVKASWRVTGDPKMGLPTGSDERVYLVLMELTREAGFTQTVTFTRYDLLKRLNWPDHHKYYKMLEDSLTRLSSVNITAQNAFWNPRAKSFSTVGFHILENYEIFSEARGRKSQEQGTTMPLSYFKWNDVMFKSFLDGNIRSIDLELALSLKRPLALRLFRYLDKKAHNNRSRFEVSLRELCKLHLGMTVDGRYESDLKASLKPAHIELIEHGFLVSVAYEPMKTRRGTKVCYVFPRQSQSQAAARESHNQLAEDKREDKPLEPELLPETESLTESLLQRILKLNVSREVALQLLDDVPVEALRLQLDCLHDREPRDQAATFVKAVRQQWELPARYLERQEAQNRAQNAKAYQETRKAQKAREEALAAQEKASQQDEADRLDAIWATLDVSSQEKLEVEARQRLGVVGQSGRAKGALQAMRRNLLRERLE